MGGGGSGIIDSIPIWSTLLLFLRLEGDSYGIVIEICSYYDCSHAELLFFFMFVHVLCFCFTFIASWVVD